MVLGGIGLVAGGVNGNSYRVLNSNIWEYAMCSGDYIISGNERCNFGEMLLQLSLMNNVHDRRVCTT